MDSLHRDIILGREISLFLCFPAFEISEKRNDAGREGDGMENEDAINVGENRVDGLNERLALPPHTQSVWF